MGRQDLDSRLAEAILDHGLKIERMVWLSVMQEGDENWDWLKEDGLDADEGQLKRIFGERLGGILHGYNQDGEYDAGCETLARVGGWILNAGFRPPDPRHVSFRDDGSVDGYMCAGYERIQIVHAPTLAGAVCKALLWKHRTVRASVAEARRLSAEKTPKP